MTAAALFWLTVAPALAALVAALVLDASGSRAGRAMLAPASLLGSAGLVAIVAGWGAGPERAAGAFIVGSGRSVVAGVVLLLTALVLLAGRSGERASSESSLIVIAGIGAGAAVLSRDLLALLLSIEVAALASYAVVAVGGLRGSRAAAMRYFVLGSVATGFAVMSLAVSAAVRPGPIVPSAVALADGDPRAVPVMTATALLVLALSLKAGAAPLHLWVPAAYANATPRGAAALASAVKLGALGAIAAYLASLDVAGWLLTGAEKAHPAGAASIALALGAAASLTIGPLAALGERSYRRMLAFSGVAQVGYALLALAGGDGTSAVVHTSLYAVATAGLFAAAEAFRRLRAHWDGSIATIAGVGRERPVLGVSVVVLLASLAGLPPFAGFWGKVVTISVPVRLAVSAMAGGPVHVVWAAAGLAALALGASVVSIAYYGSLMRVLFAEHPVAGGQCTGTGRDAGSCDAPARSTSEPVVVVCAVLVALLGLVPLVSGVGPAFSGFSLIR